MRRSKEGLAGYLFIAPFFILFFVFLVLPMVFALDLSLYKETMVGGQRFVGLENYIKVASDARFWTGVGNMISYGAVLVPVLLSISLLLAMVLDSGMVYGRSLLRLGIFLPYAIPGIIAALIWGYMYGPVYGPITQISTMFGWGKPPLLSNDLIMFSLANIAIWELTGYKMIIVYAALQSISPDLEEAATLDGANAWQYAIRVKLPAVLGAVMLNAIFSIIGTLQLFNEPMLLKNAAPGVINESFTPNIYARSLAFVSQDYSYSAAVSFVLALVVAVVSILVVLAVRIRSKRQA